MKSLAMTPSATPSATTSRRRRDAVGNAVGSADPAAQASLADDELPARAPARHNLQASCQICECLVPAFDNVRRHAHKVEPRRHGRHARVSPTVGR